VEWGDGRRHPLFLSRQISPCPTQFPEQVVAGTKRNNLVDVTPRKTPDDVQGDGFLGKLYDFRLFEQCAVGEGGVKKREPNFGCLPSLFGRGGLMFDEVRNVAHLLRAPRIRPLIDQVERLKLTNKSIGELAQNALRNSLLPSGAVHFRCTASRINSPHQPFLSSFIIAAFGEAPCTARPNVQSRLWGVDGPRCIRSMPSWEIVEHRVRAEGRTTPE